MTKEELMRKAIELSTENVANGGGPFGAVIAKDGEIIATGTNRVSASCEPTAHAEVSAIRAAVGYSQPQRMRNLYFLRTLSHVSRRYLLGTTGENVLRKQ